jgi:starch synthase (maltosyl-transferring)
MQGTPTKARHQDPGRSRRRPEDFPGRCRVVIEAVNPEIEEGTYALKAVPGETITVRADIFADGHDRLSAWVMYAREGDAEHGWSWMEPLVNDRWEGRFSVGGPGRCSYAIAGAVNRFATWQHDLKTKHRVGART